MNVKTLKTFLRDDGGAVTVDWVVLTAAIVGLALATVALVNAGMTSVAQDISDDMGSFDFSSSIQLASSSGWGSNDLLNTSGVTNEGYASWTSGYSDAELVEVYNAYHAGSHPTMLDPGDRVDSIGALEAEMNGRGIDIPAGNPSYDDLYAGYTG